MDETFSIIAGLRHHDAVKTWQKLHNGLKLTLKAEPQNRYDQHAVSVWYNDYKLGYIERSINKPFSQMLLTKPDACYATIDYINPADISDGIELNLKCVV